jgi:hypothetical protein
MASESPFDDVEAHFRALNSGSSSDLDTRLVDALVSRVSIDKAVVLQQPENTKTLLTAVISLLQNEKLDIDFDKVIEVLDVVVSQLDFEDVTSAMFSFDYLLEALSSENVNLQIIGLKVATKADPLDILANTEIIPLVVGLLSDPQSSVRLVNEIENAMTVFLHSQLIRRRILSDHMLKDLQRMRQSDDVVVKTRLFDFIVKLLPFVQEYEVPKQLYSYDDFIHEDGDVLYTLNLIKFYNDLVDVSGESLNKEWIMVNIRPQLLNIGKLYLNRFEIPDIEFFAISAISQLFKSLSNTSPELFHEIDINYIHLTKKDELLLSILNPAYLAKQHSDLIKQLPLTIDNVPVFRNLIKSEEAFALIKPQINSTALLRLPYLELVAVLVVLTSYPYGSTYLLTGLPQVMNKLLKGDRVIETETYQLRKQTLSNLNALHNDQLGVWRAGIHHEHSLTVNGVSNPGVAAPLTL